MENEKILDIKECAKTMKLSVSTIRKYFKEKGLPGFWKAGRLAFYESQVRLYFENRKKK